MHTSYMYALDQNDQSFEWWDNSLNVLFELDDVGISHIFQVLEGKKVNNRIFKQLNLEKFDACKTNVQPTTMATPGGQMTPKHV